MSYRAKLAIGALFLVSELLIVWAHWDEARALQRTIYQTLWKYTPKPDGYIPPDRFAPKQK